MLEERRRYPSFLVCFFFGGMGGGASWDHMLNVVVVRVVGGGLFLKRCAL